MSILYYEIKKILSSRSLWLTVLFFIGLNFFIIGQFQENNYPNYISSVANETGIKVENDFVEKIILMNPDEDELFLHKTLKEDSSNVINHLESYNIIQVGNRYIDFLNGYYESGLPKPLIEMIENKYQSMQIKVDEKSNTDQPLSLYFASATEQMHKQLFNTLFFWLILEGILLASFVSILSASYENTYLTENIVYTTKIGRKVQIPKLIASLLVGLLGYWFMVAVTLTIYFVIYDYSGLWSSYVTSFFNYRSDIIAGLRPFITWQDHTILTYLLAKIKLSSGLIVCFILMSFITESLVNNAYISLLLQLMVNTSFIVFPMVTTQPYLSFLITLTPIWLWLKHGIWFTDGDVDTFLKNYELISLLISVAMLSIMMTGSYLYHKRREV